MQLRGILVAVFILLALAACGGSGGGGSGSGGPGPNPPAATKSIEGVAMLGPVAHANVDVSGTNGTLVSGVTAADGSFGPLTFSGNYNGPLRVTVTGTPASTWVCDHFLGCPANNQVYPPGADVPFAGELAAVLPQASATQFVSVSLLSHIAAARSEQLGSLSTANVNQANIDIADLISGILQNALSGSSATIDSNFATIRLFDVSNPPTAGGADDQSAALLSLLNSGLVELARTAESTSEFLDRLSRAVGIDPQLPVSASDTSTPSQESFLRATLRQSSEILAAGGDVQSDIDQLLAPSDLNETIDALAAALDELQGLVPEVDFVYWELLTSSLHRLIWVDIPINTNTGAVLDASVIDAFVRAEANDRWLSPTIVTIGGVPNLRLAVLGEKLQELGPGSYQQEIEIFDTTGEYGRFVLPVEVDLFENDKSVNAGGDFGIPERYTVKIFGYSSDPDELASVIWTQISGPTVNITDDDTLQPTVTSPALEVMEIVELQVDALFTTGQERSDVLTITVWPYPTIDSLEIPDSVLQACVANAAQAGGYVDAGELTTLTCSGVTDTTGLIELRNLVSLELTDNALDTLGQLLLLDNLEYVDISGNPSLSCSEIDVLAEELEEGVALITEETCKGVVVMNLAAQGFELVLDEARGQFYASVPDRNEIIVVSTNDSQVLDRMLLPGRANGMDLSIDGTRLFVALHGSNEVAVVDLEQRSVSTIDLGIEVGHPLTYDVIEGQPERLFVTADPGSTSKAYVAQIHLDQDNRISRVADEETISSRPTLARSPDQLFLYVSEGFSPNAIYKLDLSNPNAPIVLEDDRTSKGTEVMTLNGDGSRLVTRNGHALSTDTLTRIRKVSQGSSVSSRITDTLFVSDRNGLIEEIDFGSLDARGTIETECSDGKTFDIIAFDNDQSFAMLQLSTLCIHATLPRSTPADQFADLRLPDLALEECVIATASDLGLSLADEFAALDCSASAKMILSIEGVEQFANLTTLNLPDSGIADLSPLPSLGSLQTLRLQNAKLIDVSPLFTMASLSLVDVSGNPGIPCEDLGRLTMNGVTVVADRCTRSVAIDLGDTGHDMIRNSAGDRLYVSVPGLDRISEIGLETGAVTRNFVMPAEPRGIDISNDQSKIFAALYGAGDIGVLDISSGALSVVDISAELGDDRTWDVAEVTANRIVASASPGANGRGYIAEVRTDLGNSAKRVADDTIIRDTPTFAVRQLDASVYVSSGSGENKLFKLDATQSNLPIVADVSVAEHRLSMHMTFSQGGSVIHVASGQALATDTFMTVDQFPEGVSTATSDDSVLLIADDETNFVRGYDLATSAIVGQRHWGCELEDLQSTLEFGDGIIALGDDMVCYSSTVPYL